MQASLESLRHEIQSLPDSVSKTIISQLLPRLPSIHNLELVRERSSAEFSIRNGQLVVGALDTIIQLLFALNLEYYPGTAPTMAELKRYAPIRPKRLCRRIKVVLDGSISWPLRCDDLCDLVHESLDLVVRRFPEVDSFAKASIYDATFTIFS